MLEFSIKSLNIFEAGNNGHLSNEIQVQGFAGNILVNRVSLFSENCCLSTHLVGMGNKEPGIAHPAVGWECAMGRAGICEDSFLSPLLH